MATKSEPPDEHDHEHDEHELQDHAKAVGNDPTDSRDHEDDGKDIISHGSYKTMKWKHTYNERFPLTNRNAMK